MLISKKELLKATGISYGQLYRWKRQDLIPETWFIKQSSFTGQETFFPKSKMLNRIKAIQDLKEKYSLEDLAKILAPEVAERNFTVDDLQVIKEIDNNLIPYFCNVFDKNNFSYIELLFLIAVSDFKEKYDLSFSNIEDICKEIKKHVKDIKQTNYICTLINNEKQYFIVLYKEQSEIYIDSRLKTVHQIRLSDISSNIKIKYRKSFNFRFDSKTNDISGYSAGEAVTT